MKVLAFAASTSRQSINAQLVRAAANILKSEYVKDAEVEFLDLNDYGMPIFSIDRQNENGIHELAHKFFDKIGAADALLISYAEHNGLYTAAYKNVFDWASRIDSKVFQDKPMVIMSTSPGPGGAGNVLKVAEGSAPFYGADVRGTFSLPSFFDAFDPTTMRPSSEDKLSELRAALSGLK